MCWSLCGMRGLYVIHLLVLVAGTHYWFEASTLSFIVLLGGGFFRSHVEKIDSPPSPENLQNQYKLGCTLFFKLFIGLESIFLHQICKETCSCSVILQGRARQAYLYVNIILYAVFCVYCVTSCPSNPLPVSLWIM